MNRPTIAAPLTREQDDLAAAIDKIRKAGPNEMIRLSAAEVEAVRRSSFYTSETSLIDEIFAVRVRNNIPWKRLMEIALKHAPDETREALRQINENDRAISDLLGELVK